MFKEICETVGNGPVYLESSRYEEREGCIEEALTYCEKGLDFNPKYAPLWFQYLRLYEKASLELRNQRFNNF